MFHPKRSPVSYYHKDTPIHHIPKILTSKLATENLEMLAKNTWTLLVSHIIHPLGPYRRDELLSYIGNLLNVPN